MQKKENDIKKKDPFLQRPHPQPLEDHEGEEKNNRKRYLFSYVLNSLPISSFIYLFAF